MNLAKDEAKENSSSKIMDNVSFTHLRSSPSRLSQSYLVPHPSKALYRPILPIDFTICGQLFTAEQYPILLEENWKMNGTYFKYIF